MTREQVDAINDVASAMYAIAASKGFHDGDERFGVPRDFGAWCANLHGEVSELWEAYRRNHLQGQCDKPIDLTCADEELADIVIRAMDTAAALGVNLGRAIQVKDEYNKSRPFRHGGKAA